MLRGTEKLNLFPVYAYYDKTGSSYQRMFAVYDFIQMQTKSNPRTTGHLLVVTKYWLNFRYM